MNNLNTLGDRITFLRTEKSLTQRALMDLLNFENLSKYEKNQREPKLELLIELANFFNVSLDWLITGKDKNINSSNHILKELNNDEINILKLYRQLDDRSKLKIEGMLEMKVTESKENEKGSSIYQNGENAATLKDLA
ncbi:helix-turn-helix domain-containing protein [Clostridium botulinum]|uniref:helix-turn-helix domain-containing protein n=1 Tax=Clostridium botulinum TaxID=1491 RepID=UPI0006A4BA40|nr:helix-turn-helix transcriptional regulator [Clostridium botulinum]KOC32532.1 hypothetical protein ADU81_11010 [Clostridium botulinum]